MRKEVPGVSVRDDIFHFSFFIWPFSESYFVVLRVTNVENFVFLRSCYFVDRFLWPREQNDPRNHTNGHEREAKMTNEK